MPWKAVGLGVHFSVPPNPRMLRGWEGQAAGDPENYRVQGEPLGLSVEVGACGRPPTVKEGRHGGLCCHTAFSSCSPAWWCWKHGHTFFFVLPFLVRRWGAAGGSLNSDAPVPSLASPSPSVSSPPCRVALCRAGSGQVQDLRLPGSPLQFSSWPEEIPLGKHPSPPQALKPFLANQRLCAPSCPRSASALTPCVVSFFSGTGVYSSC